MCDWDYDDKPCPIRAMVAQNSVEKLDQCLASSESFNEMSVFRQICYFGSQKLYDAMIERGYTPDGTCLDNSIGQPWFYDILNRVPPGKNTLLIAVREQQVDNVKALIAYGVDVNVSHDMLRQTPLSVARDKKNDTITQLLLHAGAWKFTTLV